MILIKFSFILLFIFSFLNAKEEYTLQIIAQNIQTNNNTISANGNVLIFSKNYYISADSIKYNKITKVLQMDGNVNVSKDNSSITLSDSATLNMINDTKSASNILLIDNKSNIWINAKSISKNKNINTIDNAVISSCDCIDPAWSIAFKKGEFDTKKQWISTYNNTLYIKDIPAWYFLVPALPFLAPEQLILSYLLVNPPYIGFSTNKERKSGLLKPLVGYSSRGGFTYYQPMYYAPAVNYDFEFIPKVLLDRGYGYELKYRYVNTKNSKLDISFGKFNEFEEYSKNHNLINEEHYGWNINYIHNNLFTSDESTKTSDGLLIALQDMNDIEYKNTLFENSSKEISTDKIIESKVKYFYNTNKFYSDINFIRYEDITLPNSNEVFQTLPEIQFHRYSSNILNKNTILSSLDVKFDSKNRITGIGANQTQISIPFNINSYFFDKFLLLDYTKTINYKNITYLNTNDYDDGNYIYDTDVFSISTDLLKQYSSFIHNINFNAIMKNSNDIKYNGDIYGLSSNDIKLKPFELQKEQNSINLVMNQNFYSNNKSEIFTHKANQILLKENNKYILGNLENEMKFYFNNGTISNRFIYNQKEKIIINNAYSFDYKIDDFYTKFEYTSIIDEDENTNLFKDGINNKSISFEISNKIYKYYTLKYNEKYDITNKIIKVKKYTLNTNKKCWNLDLSYSNNLLATATTTDKALRQKVLYVTLTLKPIVSVKQKYIKEESEE